GMAAILGLDIPALENVCAAASTEGEVVQVANDNCPGQVVISGHKPALERAMAGAKAAGAKRALPLAVSIAAHSPLMSSIQSEWDAAVAAVACQDASVPLIGNVHAAPIAKAGALKDDIRAQMQSRVRWTESVRWLAAQGVTTFIEMGSGSVLCGLIKRIVPDAQTFSCGVSQDFEALR
ncbi:MAG: ACP S-malonyltransferase, partial [Anaerolineales bacterium]